MSSLDEPWFPFMDANLDTEYVTFNDLVNITHADYERFLAGDDILPTMTPLNVVPLVDTESSIRKWCGFHAHIERHENNPWVRDLYLEKVRRQVLRLALTADAYRRDDAAFLEHTIDLYGDVKPEFYGYVASRLQTLIAAAPSAVQQTAKEYFLYFLALAPAEESISHDLLPRIDDATEIVATAEEVRALLETYVTHYDLPGWKMLIDTTGNKRIFSVVTNHKKINIPSTHFLQTRKRPLTKKGVEAIAAHELGVHAMRVKNGHKAPLKLLAYGLPSYLRGEEGAATYMQQSIEGAEEYYAFDRYLAISLARGVDGTSRDFRAVFTGMELYYRLLGYPDTVSARTAFQVTQRIFRGTTGRTPGVAYTRDTAYFEGNIGIWKLMTEKPHLRQYLTVGKYDMLNTYHIEALQALNIIHV